MREPLLRCRNLVKRYGQVSALAGIDLSIAPGSILALLGPNGAGKSTLFGCLLGLVRPTAGELVLGRRVINDADRARFGYLAERVALYPQRTVWENGWFFARLKHQAAGELERQLKRVGLYAVKERPVRQLSKGMLQRLGLALALCGQPDVLVLDEPFNGLDPALLDDLQTILREEHARGATLLISTHTISAIEPLATHVAILLEGRLALSSPIEALRQRYPDEPSLEAIYHRAARDNRAVPGTSTEQPTRIAPANTTLRTEISEPLSQPLSQPLSRPLSRPLSAPLSPPLRTPHSALERVASPSLPWQSAPPLSHENTTPHRL
jgi:ABC-type multidrug transport system ATPase subunit